MPAEARSIPILLAIAVSLIIHASAAFVIAREPLRHIPPALQDLAQPDEPDPQDPWRLGIDQAAPRTAIAWIGYDTYRAMNAPKSTIQQAAQTRQAPTEAPAQELAEAPTSPAPPLPDAAQVRQAALGVAQAVDQAAEALDQATAQMLDLARSLAGTLALPIAAASATWAPTAEPQAHPQQPSPSVQATAVAPDQGPLAERESDPSTTLPDIDADDLGQPIAAQGIIIETIRPRFSHYIRLTADPKNPLVRIHFDRGGRVRWVELVESSGYQAVDEPIKAAVYRWRAKGAALETIQAEKPDQVLIITLRILL